MDSKTQSNTIVFASWIAIVGNGLLSVAKIVIGFISGSLAVIGDGIDSATDILTSLITLVTAKIISKPPDPKHPFGYQKADDIAAKVLSFIIFFAGGQLIYSTIKKIIEGTLPEIPGKLAIYVTILSILGKLALSFYLRAAGKKTNSNMLLANGKNMQNDVIISISVLAGLIAIYIFKLPLLDYIFALLVGAWIIKTAVQIFFESNIELLDGVKDEGIYKDIFDAATSVKGVKNPHRLRTRQIAGKYMIYIDIEVDGEMSLKNAHETAHAVETNIKNKISDVYDIMVHVEPYGVIHKKEEQFGLSEGDI